MTVMGHWVGGGPAGDEHPLDYPGRPISRPVLLAADGAVPLGLDGRRWVEQLDTAVRDVGGSPLAERCPVVAIGSNAAAATMRRKLRAHRVSPVVPVVPGVLVGIVAAHSAHVSLRGYVAAAPAGLDTGASRVSVAWLDHRQLVALDASEPNYRRVTIPTRRYPLVLAAGAAPRFVELYRSVWGVLSHRRDVLVLRPQRALHRLLAEDPWLARRLPLSDPFACVRTLADPVVQAAVRRHWAASGRAVPDGVVGTASGGRTSRVLPPADWAVRAQLQPLVEPHPSQT